MQARYQHPDSAFELSLPDGWGEANTLWDKFVRVFKRYKAAFKGSNGFIYVFWESWPIRTRSAALEREILANLAAMNHSTVRHEWIRLKDSGAKNDRAFLIDTRGPNGTEYTDLFFGIDSGLIHLQAIAGKASDVQSAFKSCYDSLRVRENSALEA